METAEPSAMRQYLDGLNALDADMVCDAFASDAVIRYPGLGATDVSGFRSYLQQVAILLDSFRIEERETFSTENGVAARWAFDANFKSGHTAHCEGIDSWVIGEDLKIHVLDVYYDPTPLRQALSG